MNKLKLKASERTSEENVKSLRKNGMIPATVYGKKIKTMSVTVPSLAFRDVYASAGETTIFDLELGDTAYPVLIYDMQENPLSGNVDHVDFFQVRMDEKIEADIPLEFVGLAPAVKELGGVLVKNMDELPVSSLPGDLPHKIEVNVEKLVTFDDVVKVEDLPIDEKVQSLVPGDTIVAIVSPPRSEQELEELEQQVEEDVSKVEVEKKESEQDSEGEEGEEKEQKEEK